MSSKKEKPLPIINPVDVNEEMVDPELLRIGFDHHIGTFKFQNQDGEWITDKEMNGNISVVEYFFTTCKSICPIMNRQMQRVNKAFSQEKDIKLFSFTVDPETDSVEQMKRYAQSHDAIAGKWHFLTGEKSALYSLARKSFFVLKPAEAQNLGDAGSDFIHTNNFVLIDKQLRIRGYYDGTSVKEVNQLISDIKRLQNE
jgi:protein SCO1/2